VSFCDDGAAVDAGAGAEIDDPVGLLHSVFIVFDHDQGISSIFQSGENFQEVGIVARMEADTRFVEDVEDALEV